MEKLDINEIEFAIAEITHNLECVIEAQKTADENTKNDFTKEKIRLTKLLHKFEKMREEVN